MVPSVSSGSMFSVVSVALVCSRAVFAKRLTVQNIESQ